MQKSAGYLLVMFVAAMVYGLPASADDYCDKAYDTCVDMRCHGFPKSSGCASQCGAEKLGCEAKSGMDAPPSGIVAAPSNKGLEIMETTTDECLRKGGETQEEKECVSGVACFTKAGGFPFLECITKGD